MQKFIKMTSFLAAQAKRLTRDESGATAIEYAMIAAGIGVAIVAAVGSLGTATKGMYDTVATSLK